MTQERTSAIHHFSGEVMTMTVSAMNQWTQNKPHGAGGVDADEPGANCKVGRCETARLATNWKQSRARAFAMPVSNPALPHQGVRMEIVAIGSIIINLVTLGMNIKLFTEFAKQRMQEARK